MKKTYIIFIILAIYIFVVILFFGFNSNDKKESISIVTNNTVFNYSNKKWNIIDKNSSVIENILFNTYFDNEYLGKYNLKFFDDKWYLFDEFSNSTRKYGYMLALSQDADVVNLDSSEISISLINTILSNFNYYVSNSSDLSINKKYSYDFDLDNREENLYFISTLNYDNKNIDNFSVVIYENDNKYELVFSDNSLYLYDFMNLFKFNDEKRYKVIIKTEQLMNSGNDCDNLVEFNKKGFNILIKC